MDKIHTCFFDRWLFGNSEPLIYLLPPDSNLRHPVSNWTVSDIIRNGECFLKDPVLIPVWGIICQQDIPTYYTANTWQWKSTGSDFFCFKIAWDLARRRSMQFQLANVIWFPSKQPQDGIVSIESFTG